MFAASGYDLLKEKDNIHSEDIHLLLFGAAIAFVVAIFAIKGFIAFLTKYGFRQFGIYRIMLGILFLAYAVYAGMHLEP
jgi:undecaprenyl-diphosphatase